MVPKRSKDATKVINLVVPVFSSQTFLDHRHVFVPIEAAVTIKHYENLRGN